VTILSDHELSNQDFKEIKEEIEEKIQQPIELELTLGVKLFD
jgi:F0F1-type ATP synthase delta subunit